MLADGVCWSGEGLASDLARTCAKEASLILDVLRCFETLMAVGEQRWV